MKKLTIIIAAVALLSSCFLAQQGQKTGDVAYTEKQYAVAAGLYEKELSASEPTDPDRARKTYLIAECYRLSSQTQLAEQWYAKAADMTYNVSDAIWWYAEMLKADEKYTDAIQQFNVYSKEQPDKVDDANREIAACKDAIAWAKANTSYTIKNLDKVNSPEYDYAPAVYKDNSMVFTSDRSNSKGLYGWTGKDYSDLYISKPDGKGGYGDAALFSKALSSPFNDGAACFNKDYTECYFTRCGNADKTNDYCHIFKSVWKADSSDWSKPVMIPFFADTFNVSQPCLSPDGKELYFSSDAAGGFGGKDLYVSQRNSDGTWGEAENLGATINTAGEDVFPYVAPDGKLYFSSNGRGGMGGLDIYYTTKTKNGWSVPQNMKYPFNSGGDDFGLVFLPLNSGDKDSIKLKGLFTSNRGGGKGFDDIYMFYIKNVKYYALNGVTLQKQFSTVDDPNSQQTGTTTLAHCEVQLNVIDPQTQQPTMVAQTKSDTNGKFMFKIDPEKNYKVTATKPGYFSHSENFSSIGFSKKDSMVGKVQLVLDKIYTNKMIVIHNIYYDYDKWNIRQDAKKSLDTVVQLLKENPNIKVEIGSHTDQRGSDAYNNDLSQKRAQSVVDYLISQGINEQRLTAHGYGKTQLVVDCNPCTEEQYQLNRRTTFKVTSADFNLESVQPKNVVVDSSALKKK